MDVVVGAVVLVAIVRIEGSLGLRPRSGSRSRCSGRDDDLLLLAAAVTTAFWIVRMDEIHELWHGIYDTGRWPVTIYPGWPESR